MIFVIISIVIFIILVVLPIVTFIRLSNLKRRLFDLEEKNSDLSSIVKRLIDKKQPASLSVSKEQVSSALKQSDEPEVSQATKSADAKAIDEPQNESISTTKDPIVESIDEPENDNAVPSGTDTVSTGRNFEQNIASKWFVWIGAGAIAISGLFLVKYIADRGILTPPVRMILAFGMGAVLALGGEWLRRKPIQKVMASISPNYVPLALTSAGLFIMYASVFAAYALYDLLPPLIAFAFMAGVSILAFGLSVLQGILVAILGLLGGLITPALIQTDAPSVIGLFGYLSVVVASCVAVLRYRPWWGLGLIAVAGSGIWVLLWTAVNYETGDEMIIGLFLSLVVALFSLIVTVDTQQSGDMPIAPRLAVGLASTLDLKGFRIVALAAGTMSGLVYLFPLGAGHISDSGLGLLAVLVITMSAMAYIRPKLTWQLVPALVSVLLVFALWGLAARATGLVREVGIDLTNIWGPETPQTILRFLKWATGFAIAFAAVGFYIAGRRSKPLLWILVSIAAPLVLLIISYLTFHSIYPDRNWALAGLVVAGSALFSAVIIKRGMNETSDNLPLGLYAAAVISGLSLTFVFLLQDAWLTVALSLQLPAIAWLSNNLKLDFLRKVAIVIAVALFARLALNPFLLDYAKTHVMGEHWVLYGYGIPAVAAHFAALWFKQRKDDRLVTMLEGLRIVFAVLLISGELRILATGSVDTPRMSLLEGGMQSIAWLIVAWSRLRQYSIDGRMVDKWSGLILFGMGSAMALIGNLVINNPAINSEHTGNLPIFNTLLLAFAIPAVLMWFNSRLPVKHMSKNPNNMLIGVGVLVLMFSYVTLETRHAFQGAVMAYGTPSDAEMYTYSVVWLVFAFALLMYGLIKQRPVARYAALVVLVITVLKVFLSDMSGLEGLWRVASFLGLGLSLVAIGYLYQRFLFLPKSDKVSATTK